MHSEVQESIRPDLTEAGQVDPDVAIKDDRQDTLNASISKLALEAIAQVDQISSATGTQKEDMQQSIWTMLGLFRSLAREQRQRAGMEAVFAADKGPVQNQTGRAAAVNRHIMSIAFVAKNALTEMVRSQVHPDEMRSTLSSKNRQSCGDGGGFVKGCWKRIGVFFVRTEMS